MARQIGSFMFYPSCTFTFILAASAQDRGQSPHRPSTLPVPYLASSRCPLLCSGHTGLLAAPVAQPGCCLLVLCTRGGFPLQCCSFGETQALPLADNPLSHEEGQKG